MSALEQDYAIYQGDNTPLKITISNENSVVKDITGATITWVLKNYVDSTAAILTKTVGDGITISDGVNGELTVSFSIDDVNDLTGTYYHECRIVDSNGQARVVCYGSVIVSNSGVV